MYYAGLPVVSGKKIYIICAVCSPVFYFFEILCYNPTEQLSLSPYSGGTNNDKTNETDIS